MNQEQIQALLGIEEVKNINVEQTYRNNSSNKEVLVLTFIYVHTFEDSNKDVAKAEIEKVLEIGFSEPEKNPYYPKKGHDYYLYTSKAILPENIEVSLFLHEKVRT